MDNLGGRFYSAKKGARVYDVNVLNGVDMKLDNSSTLLVIKLPDSRALKIMSRSFFLAMFLLAMPMLCSMIGAASSGASPCDPLKSEPYSGLSMLPALLRDLVEEGLIKKGHSGFIFGLTAGVVADDFSFLRDAGVELLTEADLQQKKVVERQGFDFVFATSIHVIQQVDGIVKDSGLVISSVGSDISRGLKMLTTYKIVYLRKFDSTVVALRKTRMSQAQSESSFRGDVTPEKKKAALRGLEDVYLEPPTRALLQQSPKSPKFRFLPDLLEDSLDEYPRRIFISDDSSAVEWFYKNYPTRDQEFDVYSLDVGTAEGAATGVSTWLGSKTRREDYVVMKAEAQVVEEMLKDNTLYLVDELFLECNNQWEGDSEESSSNVGKRAYWQCLALYGKVRDEGIAVHQWWNGL